MNAFGEFWMAKLIWANFWTIILVLKCPSLVLELALLGPQFIYLFIYLGFLKSLVDAKIATSILVSALSTLSLFLLICFPSENPHVLKLYIIVKKYHNISNYGNNWNITQEDTYTSNLTSKTQKGNNSLSNMHCDLLNPHIMGDHYRCRCCCSKVTIDNLLNCCQEWRSRN